MCLKIYRSLSKRECLPCLNCFYICSQLTKKMSKILLLKTCWLFWKLCSKNLTKIPRDNLILSMKYSKKLHQIPKSTLRILIFAWKRYPTNLPHHVSGNLIGGQWCAHLRYLRERERDLKIFLAVKEFFNMKVLRNYYNSKSAKYYDNNLYPKLISIQ